MCDKSQESVIECPKRRVGTTFGSLNLEEPDGGVDCEAEWAGMGGVVGGGEGDEGFAVSRADFFEDARDAHLLILMSCWWCVVWNMV